MTTDPYIRLRKEAKTEATRLRLDRKYIEEKKAEVAERKGDYAAAARARKRARALSVARQLTHAQAAAAIAKVLQERGVHPSIAKNHATRVTSPSLKKQSIR